MPIETELKLQLEPDAVAFLEASDLLGKAAPVVKQRSLYFDTPDQKLRANAMSLRIRRAGRSRVQTLKIADRQTAGLFARSEWEIPVKNDQPKIDGLETLINLLGKAADSMVPAFEVQINRRTWIFKEGGSEIELVLDTGAVIAAGRQSAVHEIELELKQGVPGDLFSLARRLDAIVPVRLGILTKAERGYELLGPVRGAFKAEPLSLDKAATVVEAFRAIALSCLRQYRLNETLLMEAPCAPALHQARVALRRLRSAFSIFKSMLNGEKAAYFKAELRDLSAVLGEARNLDVLCEKPLPGPVKAQIEEARTAAYAKVEKILAAARTRALMLDLVEWLSPGGLVEEERIMPASGFAAHSLDCLQRRVKKDGRYLKNGTDTERHELRKDAKKLRYAAEFFATLFDEPKQKRRHRKFIGRMEDLQDKLGAINDLVTAGDIIEQLGFSKDMAADQRNGGDRTQLIKRADKAWEDLMDLKRFWH